MPGELLFDFMVSRRSPAMTLMLAVTLLFKRERIREPALLLHFPLSLKRMDSHSEGEGEQ